MGFLENIGRKVADAGQFTVQKTKDVSEVARLNSILTQTENEINNLYYQIGKLYVSMYGSDAEKDFEGMVASVVESEKKVQTIRKQIQDIKGIQKCEKCGADVPVTFSFGNSCGAPMPKTGKQIKLEDSIKCPSCGALVNKNMRFCTKCGKILVIPTSPTVESAMDNDVVENNKAWTLENMEAIVHEIMDEAPVESVRFCPECGTKITDDSIFCTECGTKL
jgi:DNA-directed RNA polymerase subunit RPC12/RpoP